MNTEKIIADYAGHIVDSMDIDSLCQLAYEKIFDDLENMSENELLDSVQEYAPHLLESADE